MSWADKTKAGLENWFTKKEPTEKKSWSERIGDWLASILSWGLEVLLDVIARKAAPTLEPLIKTMEGTGKVPPELQKLLDEIKSPTGEVGALFSQSAGSALVGGAIGKILDGLLLPLAYAINSVTQNVILNEGQYIVLWLRGVITDAELGEKLKWLGMSDIEINQLKELSQIRLNPEAIARLWLRDKTAYEKHWQDLRDSGVSEDRIDVFKELAYAMPTPADVVRFMAHEVFEEKAVTKYGLDTEWEDVRLDWFEKAGIDPDVAKLFWRDHWVHPAFREITELLHRGEITDEDMFEWYKLVEIPPHWRDKLTSIAWDLPNRIELRMMARYGLVDKDFLLEQLKQVGLKEDFRDVAADMMLAMGIRTDLSTRFSKGWLDADGVRAELEVSGLSAEVSSRMYQWIVKNTGTDRVTKERDLTKTEVYKAIKKGKIQPMQGVELIEDMGYDENEARLLVEINVGALTGSPETYLELKRITQLYRKSQGQSSEIPSLEKIQANKDITELEDTLKEARVKEDNSEEIAKLEKELEAAKALYHQLPLTSQK